MPMSFSDGGYRSTCDSDVPAVILAVVAIVAQRIWLPRISNSTISLE
jgi:hypothetical protein